MSIQFHGIYDLYESANDAFRNGKVREAYQLFHEVLQLYEDYDRDVPYEITQLISIANDCNYKIGALKRKKGDVPKFIGFDLETTKLSPDGLFEHTEPLDVGISCAALSYGSEIKVWQGKPKLTQGECQDIVTELRLINQLNKNSRVVSWNGSGFDYRVLAEESGMFKECVELALHHVDMMFLVLAHKGWLVSFKAALKGMDLKGKLTSVRLKDGSILKDMEGSLAPSLWEKGEYEAVVAYLKEDADQTRQLAYAIADQNNLKWHSKNGKLHSLDTELLSVMECLKLPLPDLSWMSKPTVNRQAMLAWALKKSL